jgi:phage shock protein C
MNTTSATPQSSDQNPTSDQNETSRASGPVAQPLCRPIHGRMLAGVAAGVADYLGVDVTIVRIILAVLTVVGVGVGVPLYLAGWLLIPEEGAPQSIASDLIQSLSSRAR